MVRPFGADFSATEPLHAALRPIGPETTGTSAIEPTRLLQGTAPMIPPMSETNPRTLWLDPITDESEPTPPPEAHRESRSDLLLGLAVSAIFVIAVITAIIGR